MLAHDLIGTGPITVALLHGVGGGRCIWDEAHSGTAQALAAAGYRVIALDLPGYGGSPRPEFLSTAVMAQQVIHTLRKLQARPAVLLGHSMGGMVAQEIVAADPQAASALILACTSPAFGKPGGDWQQQFLSDRLAPLDQGLGMLALAQRLVSGMVSPQSPPDAVARGVDVMRRVPEATYRAALSAIVGFDRRASLAQIEVPVLCLAAEDDRTAPPEAMQRMAARMPRAHYRCLARVGHLANVEAPAAFVQAVIEFLEQHGSPRTGTRGAPMPAIAHIAGDPEHLTAQQRELIDLASTLGRERFAPRAERHDREASFPFENYADLRDAGLLGICVPKAYGGLGADFATYVMVAAEIGRHCGATALTWNMHVSSSMWSGFIADQLDMSDAQRQQHERNRRVHYERMLRGKIYAQPFSEGGSAAAGKAPFGTTARKVDGGYVVNGRKIFASLAGAADYYGVLCTLDKPGATQRDSMYVAVPADAPGLSIYGDWDPLGMRGTVSRNLEFKDVWVPDDARMMPEGLYFQAASRYPHMFATLSPTYMGLAQAAYDFTVQYLRGEVPGMPPVKRRMYPTKQIAVAEMRIKLEQTRALFLQNARDACVDPDRDTRMRLYAAHYTIMENANDLARLAIRTCGGQSMLKSLPLERLYRDSRCGALMLPWTAELCMDRLGRECLYEPGERDEVIE